MPWNDFQLVLQWWATLFLVGVAGYPLTKQLFDKGSSSWFDRGYFFAKAVGMAVVTFIVYLGGVTRLVPFTRTTSWIAIGVTILLGVVLATFKKSHVRKHTLTHAFHLLAAEGFFLAALLLWSWVKAHEPSIHNLEKFMDYGFTRSILNSLYFPAPDMWYAGSPINYYYFGHTVMAVLTRLSGLDLTYTFNLMLATLFALTLTMSFSVGRQITKTLWGGALTAFLVTLAGNMQTIYAFTKGYVGDAVVPFWSLGWKFPEGLATYWYANATRFIPFTIHEFPGYSFVVSDVHGHVLSIPFAILAIAICIVVAKTLRFTHLIFYGFLCGVLLMTNALDGPIYIGLFLIVLFISGHRDIKSYLIPIVAAIGTSLPFLLHFKSFVNGIAVNCPLAILADLKIGPIIFEGVEKCQHSPVWMLMLLWGFFIYCGIWMIVKARSRILTVFFLFSLGLIIFPEFFYFKDIYPMHFRSNTMFKLGYQAFILFSIVSAYAITKIKHKLFLLVLIPQLFLVSIYPVFSVRSYFGELKTYEGIYGLGWLRSQYKGNWSAIDWLNTKGTPSVIVEADGDSYTDALQISAFTGYPTIIGWPVHEWLWRGSYDVVSPRRDQVRTIYESKDLSQTRQILETYKVRYVVVGELERRKYPALDEEKFKKLGRPVFSRGQTVIYALH